MKRSIVGIVILFSCAWAMAQAPGGPKGLHQGPMPPPDSRLVVGFFQLTEAQQGELRKLLEDRQAAVRPLAEQLGPLEQQWRELFSNPNPDPGAAGMLAVQMHGLKMRIEEVHKRFSAGFESMLDSEQARKLGFVRQAAQVQPIVNALHQLKLF